VYGLPEIHRERIRGTDLVANPGCYPTTVILGLAPLISRPEVDAGTVVVDAKSGISGAGRGAKLTTSFCEAGEGFKPYGVLRHRHIPEMEQELSLLKGSPVLVRFTPHLIPVSRGMVSTLYVRLKAEVSADALREEYERYYREEPFVRVLPASAFPDTLHVRGSNMCHVSVEVDERTGWVVAMTALDNLVKGASGAAVQNMNLIMGLDEESGLDALPLFP
jgi:N-acetyl-gamma-glutamyl-phosphate reductase